jgi:hypothetical protein
MSYDVHTFRVRAIDVAGNVDPTPATYTWTIDSTIPPPLLSNGDFELGTTGWKAISATLSSASDGNVGPGAAKLTRSNGKTYGVYPSSKVSPTSGGAVYTAGGYVRSDRPGRTVCLVIREWTYDASRIVASTQACVTAGSAWQPFPPVSYTARTTGNQLDVQFQQGSAGNGDSFELDGVTLTRG